jgi:hypothetical protein
MTNVHALLIIAVVSGFFLASNCAKAQFCPPGSRSVAGGGGTMCQCPDGSFAGISGCRAGQQQLQRQQPVPVEPRVQRFVQTRDRNAARAHMPALNRTTGRYEQRLGHNVQTKYGQVWFPNREYVGPAYVFWYEVFVEVPEDQYASIFESLSSGDEDQIDTAMNALSELRQDEGLSCCE